MAEPEKRREPVLMAYGHIIALEVAMSGLIGLLTDEQKKSYGQALRKTAENEEAIHGLFGDNPGAAEYFTSCLKRLQIHTSSQKKETSDD